MFFTQVPDFPNPTVIPCNHRVEEALEAAVERGDYSVMERLLEVLSNPLEHSQGHSDLCTVPAETTQPYRTYCGTGIKKNSYYMSIRF